MHRHNGAAAIRVDQNGMASCLMIHHEAMLLENPQKLLRS